MESSTSGRPVDLQAICRLCLCDRKDSLKLIHDEVLGPNKLPQKIELLLQIQISKYDKLTTMVCNDCIIRLDTWFAYKKQCHRNQTKLVEWLNISKAAEQIPGPTLDTSFHIKPEILQQGLVKVELSYEDEDLGDMPVGGYPPNESEHLFLEDLDINALETDDDRRCPDCGKMFANSLNLSRHQHMTHAKKERRSQMMEIRRSCDEEPSQPPQLTNETQQEECRPEPMDLEPSPSEQESVLSTAETTSQPVIQESTKNDSRQPTLDNGEAVVADGNKANPPVNESVDSNEKSTDMDTSIEEITKDSEAKDTKTAIENQPSTETSSEKTQEQTPAKEENPNLGAAAAAEVMREGKLDIKPPTSDTQEDEKKIQFAAGLRLVQKDAPPIELEPLSKIELSYIEKCKAMVSMFQTLQCACHNVQHKTIRYLLSHLRETRIWFPLYTCYNCMISLTGRSTFTKHYTRCPKPKLETLIQLSNVRKRSEVKARLYQNFKCNRCKFLFSFHGDFCKHIDEDHAYGSPPFYCSCRFVFDSLDEYKKHCYTSCILSYYCDICFVTKPSIEEFVKHAQEHHDSSEGFILLQENTYIPRNITIRHKEADDEANVLEGKRERRKSTKEPIMVQIYDREIPPDPKEIPTRVIKKMLHLDTMPPSAPDRWGRNTAQCPLCKKHYSSVNNMMRHYRIHIEKKEVEIPKSMDESGTEPEDLYTCPDCGGVYPASKWLKHLEDKHPAKSCSECDKEFQFQNELEQHRSVHLNIKVYRDSKTHAYRSAMVSPTIESNGFAGEVMVICDICDEMFKGKEELRNHKLIQHNSSASMAMETLEMSADDEQLPDLDIEEIPNNIDETSQGSNVERPFCDPCNKFFSTPKTFKEHAINKHGSEFVKKNEYPKKCEYCDKVCTTGPAYRTHTKMHERANTAGKGKEYPKKCEYCDKMCFSGAGLYIHTQMHERVTLGELKKKKEDKRKIEIIKTDVDDESYHTCKRCFKVFGTKSRLKEHMRSHGITSKSSSKKTRKILCDLCHVALDNSEALAKHKVEEHSDELDGMPTLKNEMEIDQDLQEDDKKDMPAFIYACDICEANFGTKLDLKTHKMSHAKPKTKNNKQFCKYCKLAFDSVNDLTKHMHKEHDESAKPKVTKETDKSKDSSYKPFKCPICSKGFISLTAMTAHSGWHKRNSNKEWFEPPQNTPQATTAAKLTRKEKILKKVAAAAVPKREPIETPEFQCATCFMELPNDTALQIHILEKHGRLNSLVLAPRCNPCNQDFDTKEEFETHKRFHDFLERQKRQEKTKTKGHQQMQTPIIQSVQSVAEPAQASPKKFPCSWCNSIFSRQDTLNTHIKNHHREHVKTEFECNQCNRIFDKQNSLTIHLKVHQKQKSAAAAAAVAAAAKASDVVHVNVGGSGKVYVCSLCNMGFSFPKDLRMHTINAHPF